MRPTYRYSVILIIFGTVLEFIFDFILHCVRSFQSALFVSCDKQAHRIEDEFQVRRNRIKVSGKVVVVTGGSSGIGKETSLSLASLGFKVIIASNQIVEGPETVEEIKLKTGNEEVFYMYLDLSKSSSIRDFAKVMCENYTEIDVLVCNAGVLFAFGAPKFTKDGTEIHMAINYLGHFQLTNLLLPLLRKSSYPARIIVVTSSAHSYGNLDPDNFGDTSGKTSFNCYCDSKLALIAFTLEMRRRLHGGGVTINYLHPGNVNTPLINEFPLLMKYLVPFVLITPKEAAKNLVHLAVSEAFGKITGQYYVCRKVSTVPDIAKNRAFAQRLWTWSASQTNSGL